MTLSDDLTTEIATALRQAWFHGYPDGTNLHHIDAAALVRRLDPEARDKMLLGFAVAELDGPLTMMRRGDGSWTVYTQGARWAELVDREQHYDTNIGTGPTPLAAVEDALKEVRDE